MTTDPVDLPYIVESSGRRRLVEPNELERKLAAELLRRAASVVGLHLVDPADELALAMAQAREGDTLPGRRTPITTTIAVEGRLWHEDRGGIQAAARGTVRRRWAADLAERGLRPLTWHPITVHGYRWPHVPILDTTQRGDGYPWPEVELESADLVHVRIAGDAVPEAGTR